MGRPYVLSQWYIGLSQRKKSMELLIGCGYNKEKKMGIEGDGGWNNLVTLDCNPDVSPDILHDLNNIPLPFDDNQFKEIHAYDVLEHTGRQGDQHFFFDQFYDFWRILKPNGLFFGIVPSYLSPWAFGDPSHTRVIPGCSFVFLSQEQCKNQVGKTPMSDFNHIWKGDFETLQLFDDTIQCKFVMKAIK